MEPRGEFEMLLVRILFVFELFEIRAPKGLNRPPPVRLKPPCDGFDS
jgi:hypothetical protein